MAGDVAPVSGTFTSSATGTVTTGVVRGDPAPEKGVFCPSSDSGNRYIYIHTCACVRVCVCACVCTWRWWHQWRSFVYAHHSFVRHDSFTCGAWLNFVCAMTRPFQVVRWRRLCFIHVYTTLLYMCDMTHSYLWHDSFMCVWHDSFTAVYFRQVWLMM